jgi:two-component system sensor histidine kinase MprB
VFERFYRSTTARALPGSGLGLAIVKQVVLNHGGLLRVEDTDPGGQPPGTSIYVLLPGRPMPRATYPTRVGDDVTNKNTRNTKNTEPEAEVGAVDDAAGNMANSRDSSNVISVDSQSARAR